MDKFSNLSILIPNHNEKKIQEVKFWCERFFPKAEIIIEQDKEGKGKGITLYRALAKSTKDNVVFLDGDMDIFPLKIMKLLPHLEHSDIVIGTKDCKQRKKLSSFAKILIKLLFNMPLTDTQTGIKVFKRHALPEWETDGYLFDVEILYKAHKNGFKITEVPLKNIVVSKKKSLLTLARCACELIYLRFRLLFR